MAFGVLPLFVPLAIVACEDPESYFSLAIIAFGVVPNATIIIAWEKWRLRSLASLI